MRAGAVIAASGISARMEKFQPMIRDGELSMPERVVVNFQRAGIQDIVMVTGYQAEQLEKRMRHFGITFLRDEEYENSQMLDAAKMGLLYLKDRCEKILFCPADISFFSENTVKKLLEQEEKIALPVWKGKRGHPVMLHTSLIPDILKYQGDRGLKGALDSLQADQACISVEDEGAVTKANTVQDFQRLIRSHNSHLMRPQVKVRLANQKPFFGPGTVTLLRQIECLGSVREACEKTGISYSKGWTILRMAEEELGYQIVERQPGGKNGGKAVVTEKGKQILERFEQFEKEVAAAAVSIYEKIFL